MVKFETRIEDIIMSENIRMVKFETKIGDIYKALAGERAVQKQQTPIMSVPGFKASKVSVNEMNIPSGNFPLLLIYDYKEMNDFAKSIYLNSEFSYINYSNCVGIILSISSGDGFDLSNLASINDVRSKIEYSKRFVNILRNYRTKKTAINFLFWVLMVLAVDDNKKEEHLALICDYAKMLNVTDDEVIDIVNVIKIIFEDKTAESFKTQTISGIFKDVLKLCNYPV